MENDFPYAWQYISVISYGGKIYRAIISSKDENITTSHEIDLNNEEHKKFISMLNKQEFSTNEIVSMLRGNKFKTCRHATRELIEIKKATIYLYVESRLRNRIRIRQVGKPQSHIRK